MVKEFEGCYLKAYRDEVGVWTIGYGITNSDKSITKTTIKSGLTISKATAESWLEKSLTQKYLPLVMKYNDKYKWNQNEIDALVSFCYNIGSIKGLTANGTRSRSTIASKMMEYNKAGGRVYRGLTRRRTAEKKLFTTPVKVIKKKETKATTAVQHDCRRIAPNAPAAYPRAFRQTPRPALPAPPRYAWPHYAQTNSCSQISRGDSCWT